MGTRKEERAKRWIGSRLCTADVSPLCRVSLEVSEVKNKTAQGKKTPTGMMPEPEGSNKRNVVMLLFLFWIIGLIVIFVKWGNF